jgi:hypothetical protein
MVAALTAFSQAASAQVAAEAKGSSDQATNKKALVGSWLETVTWPPESGRPPLKSLSTFHDDQTMVCSDQGAITTEPPSVFTSCHGVWTHLEKLKFAYTAVELISDLGGNLEGYLNSPWLKSVTIRSIARIDRPYYTAAYVDGHARN